MTTDKRRDQLAAARKRRRHRAREQGLCFTCTKRVPVPGGITCEECLQSVRDARAKRVAAAIAKGWCRTCCKAPIEPGKSQCRPCLDRNAGHNRTYYRKQKGHIVP